MTHEPAVTNPSLDKIINSNRWNILDSHVQDRCRAQLDGDGVVVLPEFLTDWAVESIRADGVTHQDQAFYTSSSHNVYLSPNNPEYSATHARNRQIISSKGCITTDQIPPNSALHALYGATEFKQFLCSVLGEQALHEYADDLSSINLHYAAAGQELGWHFDNSSFAITLLVQQPEAGGVFEYSKDLRDSANNDMNYDGVTSVLDGQKNISTLSMDPGCLVLFRGRDSMHRVTPTEGEITRMLVVLAYNAEPGVALSESARMTFYGRL